MTEKQIERADGTVGKIITSTESHQVRVEVGELVAAGAAIDFQEAVKRAELIERARQGERFPVRWMAGICFGDNLPTGSDLDWLRDLRVYRYSELMASLPTLPDDHQ